MPPQSRALIVDDHPIVRDTLVTTLVSLGVFDEISTSGSLQDLISRLESDRNYAIIILDLSLTDVSGPDGMIYVRENFSEIPILVFSANDSNEIVSQCFEKGVQGFVTKNASMQILVNAIQIVLAGGCYIPPEAARFMGFEPENNIEENAAPPPATVQFTPKQQEVFEQLMQGAPNKIIARRLEMAEGTVKTHLHAIYQLLGVSNRAQAILKSQQLRLINSY